MLVTDTCVRNLLHAALWNLTANRVGLLAVTDFLFHSGAGDGSHLGTGHPATAGDGVAGLFASGVAATGVAWVADGSLYGTSGNLLRFRHPVTSAVGNLACLANGSADRVTDIPVASLGFCAIGRAANLTISGFADRLAHRAADVSVAGIHDGFANRAADVAITGLVARSANGAADIAVAGLHTGFPNGTADVTIAGLVNRLADGIALVAVARLIDISSAGDRNLFRALFINGPAAVNGLLVVNGFANSFVTNATAALGGTIIAARGASGSRAALVPGCTAVRRFNLRVCSENRKARHNDKNCVSHRSVP